MGISQKHVPSPWPRDNGPVSAEQAIAPPLMTSWQDIDSESEADAHDREMGEDYIPVGPGPMPRVPKLLKGPRKRPRKQPRASVTPDKPKPAATREAAKSTPLPTPPEPTTTSATPPPEPPTTPAASEPAAKANPAIWNVDPRTALGRPQRAWPARPGTVYCEVCFRDDVARWVRFRDGAIRVLSLLGGDAALAELRTLAQEVEDAEREVILEQVAERAGGGGGGGWGSSRRRLRSPPPPPYVPSDSEEDDEGSKEGMRAGRKRKRGGDGGGEGGEILARKIVVLSEHNPPVTVPHFHEYPADVIGLVLLRVLAERPTSDLARRQKEEIRLILDNLRQELGVAPKAFDQMASYCGWLVVRWRTRKPSAGGSRQPGSYGVKDGWWRWEFDDALQAAHEQHRTPPSFFAVDLEKNAEEAELARIRAMEAATAQDRDDNYDADKQGAGGLAQVKQALGLTMASNLFLASIGDQLAEARQNLMSSHDHSPGKKRRRDDGNNAPSPTADVPPLKRHKPNHPVASPQSQPTDRQPLHHHRQAQQPLTTHLPCRYCSESDAVRHHAARRQPFPYTTATHHYTTITDDDSTKPWIKPLMWSLNYTHAAAARVRSAAEFIALLLPPPPGGPSSSSSPPPSPSSPTTNSTAAAYTTTPGIITARACEGIKFLVDVTGGETRVVLVEMGGVFDAVLARRGQGGGGGRHQRRLWGEKEEEERRSRSGGGGGGGGGGSGGGFSAKSRGRSRKRVRFAPPGVVVVRDVGAARPVGMWERWSDGRLEGYRPV
ncbi:uncharacterized protein THITE_117296 [Thermothielavioides terrestris NRRL 8126]|uniref:Uncharacterized protein n=1 Tax=Thermothielavioides terrestris (strain ATCC 38088 / NRRL 8126) TaxID=578455 RepID=G2R6I7_THETT|nr:uncharacterized protein THITE_117296 [Thermothielavioides terrestris NRRL 8126]AEO68468.1 hypothetical protein THITE_117296 [Thermothielavioides terrestris NRRL 8126]